MREAILAQPETAWTPAVDADGRPAMAPRSCELTGWVDLGNWPQGTRVLCRREDAHPGAQLRFTDHDGHRFQVFLTDQPDPDVARLELRHRQRARVEDRIRAAKATGLANLPFDLLAPQPGLAGAGPGRPRPHLLDPSPAAGRLLAVAEPKALRYRLLHVAARVVRHARRIILRLQASWPGSPSSPARSPACGPCRCAADPAQPALTICHPGRGHARLPANRARRPTVRTRNASSPPSPPKTPPHHPTAASDRHHALMKSRD